MAHIDSFRQSLMQSRFQEQERKLRQANMMGDVTNNFRNKVS